MDRFHYLFIYRMITFFKLQGLFESRIVLHVTLYSNQLLCAACQIHVVYSDQLFGAGRLINLYLITIYVKPPTSRCSKFEGWVYLLWPSERKTVINVMVATLPPFVFLSNISSPIYAIFRHVFQSVILQRKVLTILMSFLMCVWKTFVAPTHSG